MAFSRSLEDKTVSEMIRMYCQSVHGTNNGILCTDCREIEEYARVRIDKCPFGDNKPVCSACTVHCYKPAMREKIRAVMRYSGPRMLVHSPILAVRYMYRKKFKSQVDISKND